MILYNWLSDRQLWRSIKTSVIVGPCTKINTQTYQRIPRILFSPPASVPLCLLRFFGSSLFISRFFPLAILRGVQSHFYLQELLLAYPQLLTQRETVTDVKCGSSSVWIIILIFFLFVKSIFYLGMSPSKDSLPLLINVVHNPKYAIQVVFSLQLIKIRGKQLSFSSSSKNFQSGSHWWPPPRHSDPCVWYMFV